MIAGDLVRVVATDELVVFEGYEADGAEPRIARCRHAGGSVELYLPEQIVSKNDEAPPARS